MAAKTPDSIVEENLGSVKLVMAKFTSTNLDDADTWDSGITGILDFWIQCKTNPSTQGSAGCNVVLSATDTFTFYPGEENYLATLFVIAKS